MNFIKTAFILLSSAAFISACNEANKDKKDEMITEKQVSIKEEPVSYSADSVNMNGYVTYNEADTAKRPVILIVPEWWGLTDYPRSRAKQLAELGYLAMAVDMYGDGKTAENPLLAGELSGPFYKDFAMAKSRFDAAVAKIKTYPQADTTRIAAIGYCFGGAQVLNMARLGENLKGVVSFHGNLIGVAPDKETLKADVLICHGEEDKFVPATEVTAFKKQMDSIGASYTFKSYPGSTHAFTNPAATEKGKQYNIPIAYNAAADSASWNDMKVFFNKIFK
ncbi:MAG: dienelactone hydrolase family protein [Ferruginibacter sp.]